MATGGVERRVSDESVALARRAETVREEAEDRAEVVLSRDPRLTQVASVAGGLLRQQSSEQVSLAASGAAFWLVISAFPTGAAVVSLFGLVVSPAQVAHDLGSLAQATPSSLGSLIGTQLTRVAAADRTGLSIGLAVSVVTAAWSASAGVYNLQRAIRYSFGLPRSGYVAARARALLSAIVLVVALGALALSASVVGAHAPAALVAGVGLPTALVALTIGIAVMYRLSIGPGVPIRRLLPGAAAASAAVVVALAGFAVYLAFSTGYSALYGTFAGLVIGMIGMYLAVYAVLLGAVLNARLTGASRPHIGASPVSAWPEGGDREAPAG